MWTLIWSQITPASWQTHPHKIIVMLHVFRLILVVGLKQVLASRECQMSKKLRFLGLNVERMKLGTFLTSSRVIMRFV